VIKAFNHILAHSLAELGPDGSAGRRAMAIVSDDVRSKQIVMDVVNDTGFDPVDAGSLDESWRQQPGTLAILLRLRCRDDAEGACSRRQGRSAEET
jgi:predicted dinucleotide-binding enzyme